MSLAAETDAHLTEQRDIRVKHKQTYQLMGGVTLIAIGIWIGAQLFGGDAGFTTNVYTEALSILVTVLILNWFADRRATNQRKQELFLQLGSQSNDFALEAKRQLEQLGWLREALARKRFRHADWQGGLFVNMDLKDADLRDVKLTKSLLINTNLTNSNLRDADLSNAELTHLRLTKADLVGATFVGSDLTDADLTNAYFDEHTILPDGAHWTPDTDMARFTDPEHPQFWRSDDPESPAYHG